MTGSFTEPRALADLLHDRIATLESHCGAIVTRLCEGEFGVTRREWRFLGLLAQHGSLRPSELALLASLDRGSTSKTLASLLDKGLARRSATRGDARSANIGLTPSGHALYEEIFGALAALKCSAWARTGRRSRKACSRSASRGGASAKAS
ncbi:MAG: MarR family transcriptional regulator [Burkholderiales bacterium]|nr:MarR family transcriptional regulator [Burkholderiales bacterium]MDE2394184.1 MarR family transcriptional regulator [Burkholderiales bacterium]MDE2453884.1 MarR family transcriptional regulator [Burkholderiales bacterium]